MSNDVKQSSTSQVNDAVEPLHMSVPFRTRVFLTRFFPDFWHVSTKEWVKQSKKQQQPPLPCIKSCQKATFRQTQRPNWGNRCFPTCWTQRQISASSWAERWGLGRAIYSLLMLLNFISFLVTSGGAKVKLTVGGIPASLLICFYKTRF